MKAARLMRDGREVINLPTKAGRDLYGQRTRLATAPRAHGASTRTTCRENR